MPVKLGSDPFVGITIAGIDQHPGISFSDQVTAVRSRLNRKHPYHARAYESDGFTKNVSVNFDWSGWVISMV